MQDFFPMLPGVDEASLKITPEGLYSVTKPRDAREIIKFMREVMDEPLSNLTLLDGTANCGGDAINYASVFKKVVAIEKNAYTFSVLQNNVDIAYKKCIDNIELVNADTLQEWINYRDLVDALYIDAPWGGPNYKKLSSLDLYIGETRLDLFIYSVLQSSIHNKPKYICLKLPYNYNWARLQNICNHFKQLEIHQTAISNFKYVILKNS
jgi:16S rRNA G966 N2-methylase RsmD